MSTKITRYFWKRSFGIRLFPAFYESIRSCYNSNLTNGKTPHFKVSLQVGYFPWYIKPPAFSFHNLHRPTYKHWGFLLVFVLEFATEWLWWEATETNVGQSWRDLFPSPRIFPSSSLCLSFRNFFLFYPRHRTDPAGCIETRQHR